MWQDKFLQFGGIIILIHYIKLTVWMILSLLVLLFIASLTGIDFTLSVALLSLTYSLDNLVELVRLKNKSNELSKEVKKLIDVSEDSNKNVDRLIHITKELINIEK